MKTLHISVADKIATYKRRDGDIVCGNSDYQICFTFDSEWDSYDTKTARIIVNGEYRDVPFNGNNCTLPIITNTTVVEVGVYAGDLNTTTRALIGCKPSILCGSSTPASDEEMDKEYASAAKEAAEEAVRAAGRAEDAAERAEEAAARAEEAGGGSNVTIDNTLTQAGQAADAKVVGDRLSEISTALGTYITDIDNLVGEGV